MKQVLFVALFLVAVFQVQAQCPANKKKFKIVLLTDNYPAETSWKLFNAQNNVLLQSPATLTANTLYQDSICVDTGACYSFKVYDSYGDGICCNYGHGYFKIFYDNVLIKADSNFTTISVASVGCPIGMDCSTAPTVGVGSYTTPAASASGSWYAFTPPTSGIYNVTTCNQGNTCNTKLWVYDYCTNLVWDSTNLGTVYYADDNCGANSEDVNCYFMGGHTYYIRIGTVMGSCNGTGIHWTLSAPQVIPGCMDTVACNFNPFATVSVPSSCLYYPSALCPTGPDLKVDSTVLSTSITASTMASTGSCAIAEGCLSGYGTREIINFSTKIANIGATDFYAGPPPASQTAYSPIFHYDACHGHWHFTDYAEYLLADNQNNFFPIGYKNGFCVLDLMCTTGTAKFGCANMGITSGCADQYTSGLPCQWIDVTDVPDGNYKLIVRANWKPRPDFYGRYETDYFNNWARACINIYHNSANVRSVSVIPNCAPYYDCNGVENGLSIKDCAGNCNGGRLTGDTNLDSVRNNVDVTNYLISSIYHLMTASTCFDLNADGKINVIDAALLYDCALHGNTGTPLGHTHMPCVFPNKVKNPDQHALFSLGNVDTVNKTIDVNILNVDSKLYGYQLKMKGLHLSGATALTQLPFNPEIHWKASGEVVVLAKSEIVVPKNLTTTPLLRLSYSTIDSNHVCIDSVIAVVNEALEEVVQAYAVDSICVTAVPTPISHQGVANISANDRTHTLAPNPFTKTTTLMVSNPTKDDYTVTVIDVMGRTVRTYPKRNDNAINIEKGDLSPGIYYLNVRSNNWEFREKMMVE